MPKVLLLDVMGTIVTEPFFESLPEFFGASMEALLEAKHPTSWVEFERGECDEADYLARFFKDGRAIDGEGLKACLHEGYAFIEGMEALLGRLASNIEVHALSNYPIWYERIESKLNLSRFLRWSFVSCHTGVRKPDPLAYLGASEALGRPPEDCVFVDDRRRNCEAAEGVGMHAIRFRDAASLEKALDGMGLLASDGQH